MRPASYCQTEDRHPDKSRPSSARRGAPRRGRAARATLLLLLAAVLTAASASASYAWPSAARSGPTAPVRGYAPGFYAAALFQLAGESIATYAADCTTPKDSFNLSDTVCVKATESFAFLLPLRTITIVGPDNVALASIPMSSTTQTYSFTPSSLGIRGLWRADLTTITGGRRASAFFGVSGTDPAADLQLVATVDGSDTVETGDAVTVSVYVFNAGPDAASNIVVTPPSNAGLSLQSFAPVNGSDCGGPCSVTSLAPLGVAQFVATYSVTASTGTRIAATATVGSTTDDPEPGSNSDTILLNVGAVNPDSICTLTCPADIVATANVTVGGQLGAYVHYSAAGVSGDCGAVSNNPAPDPNTGLRFFPVGTSTVTSTSEKGGGSCDFSVKVLDTPAPTISCPVDKVATDTDNSGDQPVTVGTPTFTANGGGTTSFVRSDDTAAVVDGDGNVVSPAVTHSLTDPFPVGLTSILWTVTDADGRTASCTQKVTVTDNTCGTDTTPPTITAPAAITVRTGAGNPSCAVVLDDELGQAQASDNCVVTVTISGIPAGNSFAPGTYTLTYRATDAAGNTATDTQVVTVIDDTPPIIKAPDNATYTCLSEVPAASPSQARGPVLGPDGQLVRDGGGNLVFSGPAFDNCGASVTVSETATGVGSATNPRVITRTYTATDAAGNQASDVQTITVADGTPPTLNVPANVTVYLPLNTTATSMAVTYPAATATDNCSGTVTIAYSKASGSVFNVGTTTVTVTATDAVGNQTTGTFTVTVLYDFTGFFNPVSNPPTLNSVNAGRAIPVKFSLSGNKGLGIFPAGTPDSQQINCSTSAPISNLEDTVSAGGSSLSFGGDQYNYVWKTDGSWAGTCRQLVVTLNDGSTHTALFKFK